MLYSPVYDTNTNSLTYTIMVTWKPMLFSPVYDTNTNSLTYTIMAENGTSIELPREFGQTILVIEKSK